MRAAKVELKVLLYQGELDHVQNLVQGFPDFDVIMCLCAEEEPPGIPPTRSARR